MGSNNPIYPTYSESQHPSLTGDAGSSHATFPSSLGDPISTTQLYCYRKTQDAMVRALCHMLWPWTDNYTNKNTWPYPYNSCSSGPSGSRTFPVHSQIPPSRSTPSHQPIHIISPRSEEIQESSNSQRSAPRPSSSGKRKATDEPDSSRPASRCRQVQSGGSGNRKQDSASDVWYHMYGINQDGVAYKDKEWLSKPSESLYPRLGCRHCSWVLLSFEITTLGCLLVCSFITRNGNGRTKDLRIHLKKRHIIEYNTAAKSKQLKALDPSSEFKNHPDPKTDISKAIEDRSADRFTKAEFQYLLQQWLAEDPQVNKHPSFIVRMFLTYIQAIKSVEHSGFRRVLLYAGQDRVADEDLDISAGLFNKLIYDLQVCDYNQIPRMISHLWWSSRTRLGKSH